MRIYLPQAIVLKLHLLTIDGVILTLDPVISFGVGATVLWLDIPAMDGRGTS